MRASLWRNWLAVAEAGECLSDPRNTGCVGPFLELMDGLSPFPPHSLIDDASEMSVELPSPI